MWWGLLAAMIECCAGLLLTIGFLTRCAAILLSCNMIVALTMHINLGDPFKIYAFALLLLIIMIGFIFTGAGKFSADYGVHLLPWFKNNR